MDGKNALNVGVWFSRMEGMLWKWSPFKHTMLQEFSRILGHIVILAQSHCQDKGY